jgi:hypothetical protein
VKPLWIKAKGTSKQWEPNRKGNRLNGYFFDSEDPQVFAIVHVADLVPSRFFHESELVAFCEPEQNLTSSKVSSSMTSDPLCDGDS